MLRILKKMGESNLQVARTLGVTEGYPSYKQTVRVPGKRD
jgi:hypothetical protein